MYKRQGLYIVFLVLGGVSAGGIPAAHTAHLHGLPLNGADSQFFVQLVRQLHIFLLVAGVPIGGVVAGLAPADADEIAGGPEGGEAHLRQAVCHSGRELLRLGSDVPIVLHAPQVDIQLVVADADRCV